jgi:hypothetical protein
LHLISQRAYFLRIGTGSELELHCKNKCSESMRHTADALAAGWLVIDWSLLGLGRRRGGVRSRWRLPLLQLLLLLSVLLN